MLVGEYIDKLLENNYKLFVYKIYYKLLTFKNIWYIR